MLLNQSHSILYIHLQMHAQCCGLSDMVYRVLVNRQSADSVDCWPCPSCARRNSAASRSPSQQHSPCAASANPASGHRQRSPSAVTGNPLARGRRRKRQGTTATVSIAKFALFCFIRQIVVTVRGIASRGHRRMRQHGHQRRSQHSRL